MPGKISPNNLAASWKSGTQKIGTPRFTFGLHYKWHSNHVSKRSWRDQTPGNRSCIHQTWNPQVERTRCCQPIHSQPASSRLPRSAVDLSHLSPHWSRPWLAQILSCQLKNSLTSAKWETSAISSEQKAMEGVMFLRKTIMKPTCFFFTQSEAASAFTYVSPMPSPWSSHHGTWSPHHRHGCCCWPHTNECWSAKNVVGSAYLPVSPKSYTWHSTLRGRKSTCQPC